MARAHHTQSLFVMRSVVCNYRFRGAESVPANMARRSLRGLVDASVHTALSAGATSPLEWQKGPVSRGRS